MYTSQQVRQLEALFAKEKYPTPEQRAKLAQGLKVTVENVKVGSPFMRTQTALGGLSSRTTAWSCRGVWGWQRAPGWSPVPLVSAVQRHGPKALGQGPQCALCTQGPLQQPTLIPVPDPVPACSSCLPPAVPGRWPGPDPTRGSFLTGQGQVLQAPLFDTVSLPIPPHPTLCVPTGLVQEPAGQI